MAGKTAVFSEPRQGVACPLCSMVENKDAEVRVMAGHVAGQAFIQKAEFMQSLHSER